MTANLPLHKKVLFVFIIFALIFLSLEVCERLSVYYHYYRDVRKFNSPLISLVVPLDHREYVLKKDAIFVTADGIEYQINNKGLRGKEYPYNKSVGVYRILMLGDSYLFGWGLQWEDTLTVKLERLFNRADNTKRYEIINAGIYGYNSIQEKEFFNKEGFKYNPDAVILYFVINDLEPQWNTPRHPKYEYEYCFSWFFDHLVRRMNSYIQKTTKNPEPFFTIYRNRHSTLYLRAFDKETYKWISCKTAILNLSTLLKKENIDFYIIIVPDFSQDFRKYPFSTIHSKITKLAHENRIDTIDLLNFFAGKDSKQFQISKEEIHPNVKANDFVAKEIYSYLEKQWTEKH